MGRVFVVDGFHLVPAVRRMVEDFVVPYLGRRTRIFLKPNLTFPRHIPGVTTSPLFIAAVLEALSDYDVTVSVGDGDGGYGAWSAETAFQGHGLPELCRSYGSTLINLTTVEAMSQSLTCDAEELDVRVPRVLLEDTDLFVSLPVPKTHSITRYSGAVKNQWGCLPDPMRLKRHPDFPRLIWALNVRLKARVALGDATYVLDRTGPLKGDAVFKNRLIGSNDLLSFDQYAVATLMGIPLSEVGYLRLGQRFGYDSDFAVEDASSDQPNPHHFTLHRTTRTRLVAAAFSRRWAVNLLWSSWLGRVAHSILYRLRGNPIADEVRAVSARAQ